MNASEKEVGHFQPVHMVVTKQPKNHNSHLNTGTWQEKSQTNETTHHVSEVNK